MTRWTRHQFNEWRQASSTQRQKHIWLARVWLVFGVHGALRSFGVYQLGPDLAESIAVLYFISVYANYESHRAEAGTYRVEEKQEDAMESEASS